MKKFLRRAGIIISIPFIIFTILCILVYLPPIQNFAVRTATKYASEATGMNINIERISLSFPLDIVVHNTLIIDQQDTILNAHRLKAEIQLWPLLKKQIELDGLELKQASVNTANLIEGMKLQGELGKLFIASHGVNLTPETAVVNTVSLEDTHLAICLTDTTAADTASTDPLYWKIHLKDVDFKNVSLAMQMPLDSMDFSIALSKAALRNGWVDLHKSAYAAEKFMLTEGKINLRSGNVTEDIKGFDPSNIRISQLNLAVDSIYFADQDIQAQIKKFVLKERSGIEVTSTKGNLLSDAKGLHIPTLKLKTSDSYLEMKASMDWAAADLSHNGSIYARLMADIGKNDLGRLAGTDSEELIKALPNYPLQIRAGIDGSINHLRLSSLSAGIPQAFQFSANGELLYAIDSLRRNGSLNLELTTENMNFIKVLAPGFHIPAGLKLSGQAAVQKDSVGTELDLLTSGNQGRAQIKGQYNLHHDYYNANLLIDSLNLHQFMPKDTLYRLSASLLAEGQGFDFFSPETKALVEGRLHSLQLGHQVLAGIDFNASLKESKANASLNIKNKWTDTKAELQGDITAEQIAATLNTKVKYLDLMAMNFTSNPLTPSFNLSAKVKTDMNMVHLLHTDITNIKLGSKSGTFKMKDIHATANFRQDSLLSYIHAGDLVFWFQSQNNLDRLMTSIDRFSTELGAQWKRKSFNQEFLKRLMPDAHFGIYAGHDNPLSNLLATNKIKFNKLNFRFETSPQEGIHTYANLYGFRTDSLKLDTIFFNAYQDSSFHFAGGVKALPYKKQEAFNIDLTAGFKSKDGNINLVYRNEKGQEGVNLGTSIFLRDKGMSIHLSPANPTLVYRTFQANSDNYIYMNDEGRIDADLDLFDKKQSGLSLHSTPDSLALQNLTLGIHNIDIEEFQRIIPYMPDIAGFINAETHLIQTKEEMQMSAELGINKLAYNKQEIGDLALSMVYLPHSENTHYADGYITLNNKEVINMNGTYYSEESEESTDQIDANIEMNQFPLDIANAFIPDQMAIIHGKLNGSLTMSGSTAQPAFNGKLGMNHVTVDVPQASLGLTMDDQPLNIKDSKLVFDNFRIMTSGKSPFLINGNVGLNDMKFNLKLSAKNFELFNAKKTKAALIYGKLYVDMNSTIKGNADDLKMRGNMNILGNSDFTYVLKDSPLTVEDRLNETVTFVNFNDTLANMTNNLPSVSLGGVDLMMTLHIDEAVQAKVDLNTDGSNYMKLEGGGDLSFQYQPDGTMVMNGRYILLNGEMKYQLPIMPTQLFHIKEGSYIEWTGNVMNPKMNIKATERVKASVSNDNGTSRNVNFDVGVSLTNRLDNLGFTFTLEAPDDGAMQNELAAKSPADKNKLAVTMLVTGLYLGDSENASGKANTNNTLNSYLQGQINKMAGKLAGSALKTVDINLGIENNQNESGGSSTDYSFQFAKRFWNNRFQIIIGGKISTGNNVQQDDSFIDNVSIEYRLDKSGTRYIKIFHDKNYESVLDGEVIETGAGVVLRKKVSRLGELFIFQNDRKKKKSDKKNKDKKNNEAKEEKEDEKE